MKRILTKFKSLFAAVITKTPLRNYYNSYVVSRFDKCAVIYKQQTFNEFEEEAFRDFRPNLTTEERKLLEKDMIKSYLFEGIRPDEYFLYNYDDSKVVRNSYLPQKIKDNVLIRYYGNGWTDRMEFIKDKYSFYCHMKPFFKRDAALVSSPDDWQGFNTFCGSHKSFIAKENRGACGVAAHIVTINSESDIRYHFERLLGLGNWIVEELIEQNEEIAEFNSSSVNTVRFPSFRHGNNINQVYPCMRFGRSGNIVDNAGQGGVFVSVDIKNGIVNSDAFNEHGFKCEIHPDSRKRFKGFQIPEWDNLLEIAKKAHLSMPVDQTYIAFDFALSKGGWVLVEANWGDWVLQQTSLQRGMKEEFIKYLQGKL